MFPLQRSSGIAVTRVVIVGGGFAGIACAQRLRRHGITPVVIEKKETFDFFPVFPDCISGSIPLAAAQTPVRDISRRWGFAVSQGSVAAINTQERVVRTSEAEYAYDYLVIASGVQPQYYQHPEFASCSYTLESGMSVKRIMDALASGAFKNYVVAGGGYTGLEAAAGICGYLKRAQQPGRVYVIEKENTLGAAFSQQMRAYVSDACARLGITCISSAAVAAAQHGQVTLDTGQVFSQAMLLWCAGSRGPDFLSECTRGMQQRIVVDRYLRSDFRVYVVGDAALYKYHGRPLRMSVAFARGQGQSAADTIARSARGASARVFTVCDPGFIIPLAGQYACGNIFGVFCAGRVPLVMHYALSSYYSIGFRAKARIMRALFV